MGLGSFHTFSLADAREEAKKCRKLLAGSLPDTKPVDPIEHRRKMLAEARIDAAKATTFKDCAERFIAAHKANWRDPKHAAQWAATLVAYVYPLFGALPVQAVDVGLVLKAIEPIWTTKAETASRVRGRIESVLDYATAHGWRRGENPARWRGHLDQVLPAPSKAKRVAREASGRAEHHPAMPFDELPDFLAELRTREALSARTLDFTILTAMRTETVLGAKWLEIDRDRRIWNIPDGRPGLKRRGGLRVPLSDAALAVLDAVGWPEPGDVGGKGYIFPGAKPGKPLSNMAMLNLMQERMGRPEFTVHGFRSSFRDWAAERTNFPSEVVEMALGHTVSDKVEAAYRRGDLFEKRRELMLAWEAHCANEQASRKVVSLMNRV
jgi:integrase